MTNLVIFFQIKLESHCKNINRIFTLTFLYFMLKRKILGGQLF